MNAPKYRSLPAVKHHRVAAVGAIFKSVLGEGLLSGTDVFFLPGRYSPMLNVVRAVVVRRAIRLGMGDINCRSWSPAGFQIKNINWEAPHEPYLQGFYGLVVSLEPWHHLLTFLELLIVGLYLYLSLKRNSWLKTGFQDLMQGSGRLALKLKSTTENFRGSSGLHLDHNVMFCNVFQFYCRSFVTNTK